MKTHDGHNERIKRRYLTFLKEAKRFSESSLDGVAKAIHRFESYNKFRDLRQFHIQQAIAFKADLANQRHARTRAPLSKATLLSTLSALKAFFQWLAGQPGYKSRLKYADAEYFNLSEKEMRVARARRDQRMPTLEQIRHVLATMPAVSEIERRNRALIAFTLLTGARDGATASLKLKHVDMNEGKLDQDAREVNTKFSKTFRSCALEFLTQTHTASVRPWPASAKSYVKARRNSKRGARTWGMRACSQHSPATARFPASGRRVS
jgi:integrase